MKPRLLVRSVLFAVLLLASDIVPASADPRGYRSEVMADRPLAYYRLDERNGNVAHDASGNGFDGRIGQQVVRGAPGLIPDARTSMEFNGADESAARNTIRIKGNARFARPKDLSIEAWVMPNDVGVHGHNSGDITLAAYGQDDNPDNLHCRYALELDAHSHVFHFPAVVYGRRLDIPVGGLRSLFASVVERAGPPHSATYLLYAANGSDGNPPQPHRRYHLVGTYDGETMRFYVNGHLSSAMHVRGRIVGFLQNDGFGIGGEFVDENPVFSGRISEVAVYDRTLSAERILAHYRAGIAGRGTPHTR